jgi:hypothetical protein
MAQDLKVQIIVGTEEDLRHGVGEVAVTIATIAAKLGVSVSRARGLIDEGVLAPVAKIGKTALFRVSDVEKIKL